MRALFVATVQSHIAQFHMGAISLLKENGYEVDVAAKNNLKEKNGLAIEGVNQIFNVPFERSPFSLKNVGAYSKLKRIIDDKEYDIIHCNTPVGGILTRLAARKKRKKGCVVIYTAHGFHFYKGASKKNWLIFYPIEKIMSKITDKLITINQEDYELAITKFLCPVFRIHGAGVLTKKYDSVTMEDILFYRRKYQCEDSFIILCTGELNHNKNQKTIIRSMVQVVEKIPNAILFLAGNGSEEKNLKILIKELGLEKHVRLLGYRTDLQVFVRLSDLVVSASVREGLGINVLEAMYCKKAVVASSNRGHKELIQNEKSGFLVNPHDFNEFAKKIIFLALNKDIRDQFGEKGFKIAQIYTDKAVYKELKNIYELND